MDTGFVLARTGTNIAVSGGIAWTNPGRITTTNSQFSETGKIAVGGTSARLRATNFGFTIPDKKRVAGIDVAIYASSNAYNYTVKDYEIQLVYDGSLIGNNHANVSGFWADVDNPVFRYYGHSYSQSSLWGVGLKKEHFEDSSFGVSIRTIVEEKDAKARVQRVYIKLFFEDAPTSNFFMFL